MKRSVVSICGGLVLGACCLVSLAACGLPKALQLSTPDNPPPTPPTITIHPIVDATPTPVDTPYKVAAWASDDTPQAQERLYARFTHSGIPVPGASITFVIHYPGNDVTLSGTTDSDGVVTVETAAGNGPVTVDVYASYEGIRSHNAAFFYGGIIIAPTAVPSPPPGPVVTPGSAQATAAP
jgi:hypothetical protein